MLKRENLFFRRRWITITQNEMNTPRPRRSVPCWHRGGLLSVPTDAKQPTMQWHYGAATCRADGTPLTCSDTCDYHSRRALVVRRWRPLANADSSSNVGTRTHAPRVYVGITAPGVAGNWLTEGGEQPTVTCISLENMIAEATILCRTCGQTVFRSYRWNCSVCWASDVR